MLEKFRISLVCAFLVAISAMASARAEARNRVESKAAGLIQLELQKKYPGTKIALTSAFHWLSGELDERIASVQISGETGRGEAQFDVIGRDGEAESKGWVAFEARLPARIALKRIRPGEKLSPDMFAEQWINVAVGQAHDFWGIILPVSQKVENLQTRQTVLEGQFLTSTAVENIPDIRRGDMVQIQLNSGNMVLSTQGTAQEPGYLNSMIHVLTGKSKRELVGKLTATGVVEVNL